MRYRSTKSSRPGVVLAVPVVPDHGDMLPMLAWSISVLESAGSDAGACSPCLGWCPGTRPVPALGRCSPLVLRWDLRLVKVPGSTAGLIMRASFTSPGIRRFTAVSVREHRHLACHPFFNGVLHVCIHNRIPLPKAHKGNKPLRRGIWRH